jgi:hypothetical protein
VQDLLTEACDKRFNVFDKFKGSKARVDRFVIRADSAERWLQFNPNKHVWAVFGYQTAFGLIRWSLTEELAATRREIEVFGETFLALASQRWSVESGLPKSVPKNKCAQQGYLHRLCSIADPSGSGVTRMLGHAVEQWPGTRDNASTLSKVRSIVPLLHNEAYQMAPYGIGQVCFLLCGAWGGTDRRPPEEMYWRFVGNSVKRCLLAD